MVIADLQLLHRQNILPRLRLRLKNSVEGPVVIKIRRIDPDLVLCGRRTVDGETGQVGPQLAVRLGMSCVANATGLTLRPGAVEARRLTSDRIETVEAPLPAVVTVAADALTLSEKSITSTSAAAMIFFMFGGSSL